MNRNIIITSTVGMSQLEWHAFRMRGIGASEIGTVLGLNQRWSSPIELWYKKLDPSPRIDIRSFFALNGLEQENTLAKYHRYWGGSAESVVKNMNDKKVVRKNHKINAFVNNPKYPWLFASPDRLINKTKTAGEGVLELKTMNSFEARKWEATVPPSYLLQVQQQMLVCDVKFGELATLTDGMFDVIPFTRRADLEEMIIDKTKSFWDSVLTGRKILTQKYNAIMNHNIRAANDLQAELESLEPALVGGDAEEAFLKEKYKSKPLAEIGLIKGNESDWLAAIELKAIKDKIKALGIDASFLQNTLIRRIADGSTIDFGNRGRVSHSGSPKRFTLNLK